MGATEEERPALDRMVALAATITLDRAIAIVGRLVIHPEDRAKALEALEHLRT